MIPEAALTMDWSESTSRASERGEPLPADREASELVRAVRAGDTDAFAGFYEQWFPTSLALVRTLTRRDESFCLDVVQDVMLRVVRALPPLEDAAALEAWLRTVVRSTALDHLRRETRRARREIRAFERGRSEEPRPVSERLELEERSAWLAAQIAELDAADRALLALRYQPGQTFRSVGAAFGLTGNSASGRLTRLLARLRALARQVFRE